MHDTSAVTEFRFGTKAETLQRLDSHLTKARLCEQLFFTVDEWRKRSGPILDTAISSFSGEELVIRSSARSEDTGIASLAGAFLSCIGVPRESMALTEAVEQVIASYGEENPDNQILIQPRLERIAISGVVITRDLDTGAPYYVINYDDFSGRTDLVTSGAISKVVLVHRERLDALMSPRIRRLIDSVREIEAVTGSDRLDIEFCINWDAEVFVLQVRPLAASNKWTLVPDVVIDRRIDTVRESFRAYLDAKLPILGSRTIFGRMPDWNPAEMIGGMPRPLAYSIYSRLVTERSWAVARSDMGYRDMVGAPLMTAFAGQPFIDVRLSLNSFLPADLNDSIGTKVIDRQLTRLADHPKFHDKIEFGIAVPSADFLLDQRLDELRDDGLSAEEIDDFRTRLVRLTTRTLDTGIADMHRDEAQIARLTDRLQTTRKADLLEVAFRLFDVCAEDGLVPFARLARHAFIGISFLRSMQSTGLLEPEQSDQFIASVRTIASEIVTDMNAVARGELSQDRFLKRYGHLRPGTYDITSSRYDHEPDHYLGGHRPTSGACTNFSLSAAGKRKITRALSNFGTELDADGLFAYMAQAIRLRELAKFRFSRVLSQSLELIAEWGQKQGLTRDDLSFLKVSDLVNRKHVDLEKRIAEARHGFQVNRLVRLPHLIRSVEDVDVVRVPLNEPSYITQAQVSAPVIELSSADIRGDIDGYIILIESADPGFDWIFSHDIKGLITKYGGANSHMAIRCAEFGIPAAIGCGERLYNMIAAVSVIELNCGARAIKGMER